METFYEKFPKEILPKEYGGNEGSALTLHGEHNEKKTAWAHTKNLLFSRR